MIKRNIVLLLLLFPALLGFSQTPEVKSYLLADSVEIGRPFPLAITIYDTLTLDILLPDSTSNFSGYNFIEKVWFPSVYRNNQSIDSVVYYFSTFDISAIQSISIQFYTWNGKDSVKITTPADTFHVISKVDHLPDSLSDIHLMETTAPYRVNYPINTTFIYIGIAALIVVLAVLWLIFGKKIRIWWKVRGMNKKHQAFKITFIQLIDQINEEALSSKTEQMIIHWKSYMETLDSVPYQKLTTKEIGEIKKNKRLRLTLQCIDQAIYANSSVSKIKSCSDELLGYSEQMLSKKLKKIKDGK